MTQIYQTILEHKLWGTKFYYDFGTQSGITASTNNLGTQLRNTTRDELSRDTTSRRNISLRSWHTHTHTLETQHRQTARASDCTTSTNDYNHENKDKRTMKITQRQDSDNNKQKPPFSKTRQNTANQHNINDGNFKTGMRTWDTLPCSTVLVCHCVHSKGCHSLMIMTLGLRFSTEEDTSHIKQEIVNND